MHICILNVLHAPFDKRVFQKVAKSLVGAGHRVTSIVPSIEVVPETDGIQFRTVPPAHGLPARFLSTFRLAREGRKVAADVYLGVEPESWVAALLIKLTRNCKVVFDVHEYAPTEFAKFFPVFLRPFMAWIVLKFMRAFARVTDHIVLTRDSFDDLMFAGLSVPRTVVINTNHIQPKCETISEDLSRSYADRPTVIHQGIFGDIRGSWQLLAAMKEVFKAYPDLKCIVLGDYVYGSLEEYNAAIRREGLDEVFDIIPSVPYEKVPEYIAVSDAGLILFQPGPINHTLAMPHKLFDYMREGVPVVAPDFALEVRAIMEDSDCGVLVDVTDPRSIAEGILSLLNNPDRAKRLGANGRSAVETKYNWQSDEKRLLEAFATMETR